MAGEMRRQRRSDDGADSPVDLSIGALLSAYPQLISPHAHDGTGRRVDVSCLYSLSQNKETSRGREHSNVAPVEIADPGHTHVPALLVDPP